MIFRSQKIKAYITNYAKNPIYCIFYDIINIWIWQESQLA